MGSENAATSIFSFATPEWLKSFNGGPQNLYAGVSREAFGFTASRLQEQADHLKNLAECADFAEALKCQFEFAHQSWSRSLDEAWKAFDHLRTRSASGG